MSETNKTKPSGGWKQYETSIWVLLLYPMLILGGALAILPLLPHFQQEKSQGEEVVRPSSHEPFHFSLSLLPSLRSPVDESKLGDRSQ